jgi:hypothetical protein
LRAFHAIVIETPNDANRMPPEMLLLKSAESIKPFVFSSLALSLREVSTSFSTDSVERARRVRGLQTAQEATPC